MHSVLAILRGLCFPCASPSADPWTLLLRLPVRRQLGRGRGPLASVGPQILHLKTKGMMTFAVGHVSDTIT